MNDFSPKQKFLTGIKIKPAIQLVWQSAPGWTVANALLVIIQGFLPLLSIYLMKLVIDAVTAGLNSPDKPAAFSHILLLIGMTAAVILGTNYSNSLGNYVRQGQSLVVTDYMKNIIHAQSIRVDLSFYENARYYDTLHRAQHEGYRCISIVNNLAQFGRSGLSMMGIAGMLFMFHWSFSIILFLAVIPGIIVRLTYSDKLFRWQRQRTALERKANYFSWLLTGDAFAKEVRLFELGNHFRERFCFVRQEVRREKLGITRKQTSTELTTQTGATILGFGAYAFLAYRAIQGAISLGDMVMYFQAFQKGQSYVRELLGSMAGLYEDNLFLSNLYEFLNLKPTIVEPGKPQAFPRPITSGIVFDNVSFQYAGANTPVLQSLNLVIRPGEKLALVGANGVGKTTFIKLLCRLYDPGAGRITIDGIDLRDFPLAELRRNISVVFQDYAKYHLTAKENIWLGDVALTPSDGKIETCARLSGADKVIDRLAHGYDTILGKWFDEGTDLSIGEWQKIALARTFLRQAQIIILDEPTSAMDAHAEYELFQKFRQLTADCTAILISHRFSTVRMADTIGVINSGKLIEYGSHDELLAKGGTYARLFTLQANFYQ